MPNPTPCPTSKLEILEALEGQWVQTPDGQWHQVQSGCIYTRYGAANLLWHEVGTLEWMLRNSKKPEVIND